MAVLSRGEDRNGRADAGSSDKDGRLREGWFAEQLRGVRLQQLNQAAAVAQKSQLLAVSGHYREQGDSRPQKSPFCKSF